jgi:hypothetical protein
MTNLGEERSREVRRVFSRISIKKGFMLMLFCIILTIASEQFALEYGLWETVAPYVSNALTGVFIFTAGIAWVGWYIKKNWQDLVIQQPFELKNKIRPTDTKVALDFGAGKWSFSYKHRFCPEFQS